MKTILLLVVCVILFFPATAQVAIATDGSAPDISAMLDVKSAKRGILIPRISTAQLSGIGSPANGFTMVPPG